MKLLKAVCFLVFTLHSSFSIANPESVISSFLDFFNNKEPKCETCIGLHDAEENDLCPDFFIKQILEEDYSPGFLLKAPAKSCPSANSQNRTHLKRGESWAFKNSQDLENFLREHKEFSGFKMSPFISKCLSKPVTLPPPTPHAVNLPQALPKDQHFLATGEYYLTLKRLQEALRNDIEDLAGIDNLIGKENLLKDVSCNGLQFTQEASLECSAIKKCSSETESLLKAGEDTLIAMRAVDTIDKEIRKLSPGSLMAKKNKKEIDQLKQRKEVLKALYPWMAGSTFQSGYDPEKITNKEEMAKLIKSQLTETRKKLKEQFVKRKEALNCMSGMKGENCSSNKIAKTLSQTPALTLEGVFGSDRESLWKKEKKEKMDPVKAQKFSRESVAQLYFAEAQCRQQNRGLIAESNRDVTLGLFDVAAVLGTAGVGSAIVAARIAARAGGLASRAGRLQATALLTADTVFSLPYMNEARKVCSEGFDRLERQDSEALSSKNVCKRFPVRSKLSRDYTSCLLSASLASLPITMPLAGLVGGSVFRAVKSSKARAEQMAQIRALTPEQIEALTPEQVRNFTDNQINAFTPEQFKVLERSYRRSLAENSLGRKSLTDRQIDMINDAHLVGAGQKGKDGTSARLGNYTEAQLREKNRILKEAGFSPAERRKLIEDGVIGDKRGYKKRSLRGNRHSGNKKHKNRRNRHSGDDTQIQQASQKMAKGDRYDGTPIALAINRIRNQQGIKSNEIITKYNLETLLRDKEHFIRAPYEKSVIGFLKTNSGSVLRKILIRELNKMKETRHFETFNEHRGGNKITFYEIKGSEGSIEMRAFFKIDKEDDKQFISLVKVEHKNDKRKDGVDLVRILDKIENARASGSGANKD